MELHDEALRERATRTNLRKQAASDELSLARERLSAEIEATFRSVKRSLLVERQAIGLSLFDTGFRAMSYAVGALTALVVVIAAALLFLTSARRGLQLWTNGAWWSDLVLAVLLLALVAGAAHGVRRFIHRSTLAKTRRMLNEPAPAKPDAANGRPA